MTEQLERQLIKLIATDRIEIPISSMSGKLKRQKPKIAGAVDLGNYDGNFRGERVYARVQDEQGTKARGMSEAISVFCERYPQHGKVLQGLVAEKRVSREPTLYFGMNEGCRLTEGDYMGVMTSMGFTENTAQRLYPELMDISRKLSRKRDEERNILVG